MQYLFKHYQNYRETLEAHQFIELHLMAKILLTQCVNSKNNGTERTFPIQHLLILMVNPGLFTQFIEALQDTPSQTLNKSLDDFFQSCRGKIINNI